MGPLSTVAVTGSRLKWERHLCAAGAGPPLLAPLHIQAHTCSVSYTKGRGSAYPWDASGIQWDGQWKGWDHLEASAASVSICSVGTPGWSLWGVLSLGGT